MDFRQARLLLGLVFCSGWCALVYQIGWLRELRLVFGASTYATAAVLAIFMGGLGVGGAVLGRRADVHRSPLRLYGMLEFGVGLGALTSPFLFAAVRKFYFATGGAAALGQSGALAVRLALSSLVLAAPTFLMGGTLPAAAGAAEPPGDGARRWTALLYGVNALGAVLGALATTFYLLEHLGTWATIQLAATVNLVVGGVAVFLAGRWLEAGAAAPSGTAEAFVPRKVGSRTPPRFVYAAAAVTGFVFFLMEIVWYRMLSPLLGGTTYTFGLILAVALSGVGLGGALASFMALRLQPTVRVFAVTCGLEALGLAAAFGLGDRIALLALFLRPQGDAALPAFAAAWTLISAIVVFPGALVAGYQFPLLIGLLGRGREGVGGHTGAVCLSNTAGGIAGSLIGGFGLLPALGAPGCWRLSVMLLGGLCAFAIAFATREEGRRGLLALAGVTATTAIALIGARGPTAAWRHGGIGVGQVWLENRLQSRAWLNDIRYATSWETDGVESSIAIHRKDGLAFFVNGKVDGNAKHDSGTQIMAAMVGAILHPAPRKAMVIGLGTGSSGGWLAKIDGMERVDIGELEPAVVEVARRCASVNHDVLSNPRVRLILGDARELLMTTRERYDLIMSEPSNPYRAGIASLYTLDFYRSIADRLAPGGFFSQWVQAYNIDPDTLGRIAATLRSVFGSVELWQTGPTDLLFVCSAEPREYSVPALAARLATEPFRSALRAGWGLEGLEGFLSGYFATDAFARHALQEWGRVGLNTDDRSPVEFGLLRSLGSSALALPIFHANTRKRSAHRPPVREGPVDWEKVDDYHILSFLWQPFVVLSGVEAAAAGAYDAYARGDFAAVVELWEQGRWKPVLSLEHLILGVALANSGDPRALQTIPRIAPAFPGSAAAVEALYFRQVGNFGRSLAAIERAVARFRVDPWDSWEMMNRTLTLGLQMAEADPELAGRVYDLFAEPFSTSILEQLRVQTLVNLSAFLDCGHGERALAQFEPNPPWDETLLRYRAECYAKSNHPLAGRARRDLEELLAAGAAR